MTHAHITTWLLAIILFLVAVGLHRAGKNRGLKVVQMILRLFYVLIIATGIMLLLSLAAIPAMYILKTILGVLVIGFMEMVLSFTKKGKSTALPWVLLVVAFVAVVYLGFDLPLGF